LKKSMKIVLVAAIALMMSTACSHESIQTSGGKPTVSNAKGTNAGKASTVAVEHLHTPWSIQFDGDTIYVSEREGNIVMSNGGTMTRQKVRLNKQLKNQGEGGLLGIQLAPDFRESRQAYAYHTYEEAGKVLNRVVVLQK
jgi:glucose/arabinose dehydrogenase